MKLFEMIFAGFILLFIYFITIACIFNLLDDWKFYKKYRKRKIIQVIKNSIAFILMLIMSVFLTFAFVSDYRHPENKVKQLKNHVESAQKALNDYLEKHPEYKEKE